VATPPRCHGGGGPAGPPEDVDSESAASGDPAAVFGASVAAPFGASPEDVPSVSSTAGTRVVDSAAGSASLARAPPRADAGAGSSVSVRAPPAPDVSDDVAGSGSSGLLGVLTRTRLVGR
jgi:hypothetical protein